MIRIFAGSYNQAKDLAIRLGLKRSEWAYLDRTDRVKGLRRRAVLEYGTVAERSDYREMRQLFELQEFRVIKVPDRGPIPENVLKAIGRA